MMFVIFYICVGMCCGVFLVLVLFFNFVYLKYIYIYIYIHIFNVVYRLVWGYTIVSTDSKIIV